MPANLPPQYFEAEKRYREAKDPAEKIVYLEEMLAIMPKHKGTDHLHAELRSRIAKLTQLAAKKSGAHHSSLLIDKEGAAQVAVIGLPNSGKSQLFSSLTNASSPVADYPFTTSNAIPGMMWFENIQIQLIDTPPLAPQSIEFWLPHILRRADALLLVVDLREAPVAQVENLGQQLEDMRIRLEEKKALIAGNKIDLENTSKNYEELRDKYKERLPVVAVSAKKGTGLEELKREIYRVLNIIRVYTKSPGQKPDINDPITLERGSTLEDAAAEVHKDFVAKLKYARVWGSGKHEGVRVKRDHALEDGDVIELHI